MDAIMGSGADTEKTGAATDQSAAGTKVAAVGPIQWHPISLIRGSRPPTPEGDDGGDDVRKPGFALIVLNQPITHYLGIIRRVWKNGLFHQPLATDKRELTRDVEAFTRIAADGGANCLYDAAGVRGDDSFVSLES
jgi:thiamine pyrophosphokinase